MSSEVPLNFFNELRPTPMDGACACGATHPHICLVLNKDLQPVKAFYVDPSTSERFDVHAHWVFGEAAAELRATIGVRILSDKELREL